MKRPAPEADPLANWRAHFSVETQRRGEEYARTGRVEITEHDGSTVFARVKGQQRDAYLVEIDLRSRRVDDSLCSCRAFADAGPCKHIFAVLCVVLAGVGRPAEVESIESSRLRAWLAGMRRIEDAARAGALPPAGEEQPCRVEYVIVLDDASAVHSTVIETRRAKPLQRGGWGKSTPFSLLAPRDNLVLAPEDRQLAAFLRGARSMLFDGAYRARSESRYLLDPEQTAAFLPQLAATQRLYWSKEGGVLSSEPLVFDDGGPWTPCTTLASDDQGALRLGVKLVRGAERVDGAEIRGVLAGDFVVLERRIVSARLGRGRGWIAAMVSAAPPPPVSVQDAPELLLELARRELDAEPGPGLENLISARPPIAHLTLSAPKHEDGHWSPVAGFVEFDYGIGRVLASDRRPLLPTGRGVLRRYFEVEEALLARPAVLGTTSTARGALTVPLASVPRLVRDLTGEGWVVAGEGAKWRTLGAPKLSVKSGVDWFELEGRFEGLPDSEFPNLLAALRRGESTVVLGDGTTGIVPDEWLARWKTALSMGETKGGKLRFRSSQAWFVDVLLDEFVGRESERVWSEQCQRLAQFERIQPVLEPRGFRGELRPYQREGLGWLEFLERQHFGGCLADDMGLGKTVQVLAWLQARKSRTKRARTTLIVAPKSLTHNWIAEAARFAPELSTLEYVGADRKRLQERIERHDIVLTTYGTMRSDADVLSKLNFGVVVLDEAQAIKNEGSRTARAARVLRADHRLALSGTPIENHLGELWSLFEFLNPGMLGRSTAFQSLIATTPEAGLSTDARSLVATAVRPFLLRRTKEQVLRDLPERSEQTLLCDMEPAQEREYVALRDHFRRTLLEKKTDVELARDKLGILEMLLRLRQAACHPALLDVARADESCAKFDTLFPLLEEVLESGHKALVFSQFTSFLALVRRKLDASARVYGYLDGKSSSQERASEVERFQTDPACKLFLISLKAGGTGLNLTAADYVFLLDPWWNPAVEAQAIGRSHRIGQERNVFAYRMVCSGTIEERVLELQSKKRELASAILDGDGSLVRDLTREDLERLLS